MTESLTTVLGNEELYQQKTSIHENLGMVRIRYTTLRLKEEPLAVFDKMGPSKKVYGWGSIARHERGLGV